MTVTRRTRTITSISIEGEGGDRDSPLALLRSNLQLMEQKKEAAHRAKINSRAGLKASAANLKEHKVRVHTQSPRPPARPHAHAHSSTTPPTHAAVLFFV